MRQGKIEKLRLRTARKERKINRRKMVVKRNLKAQRIRRRVIRDR
jgi:hypothetical protein